ncbi:MAG: ATP-binding protein [Candidatus Lokiarchaeota archaeon]|nr:ATP-binding protein [Candidatus Lokiarchaeota archaeon]
MSKIKFKIVVMSGKGGVGKSTVASNLAMALALNGFTVGLIDADITGPNIPKMMGIPPDHLPNVDSDQKKIIPVIGPLNIKIMSMAFLLQDPDTPIIWRGPLKMGAINQFLNDVEWGNLDFLIVDLPPGTSDETISILQLIKGARAIVVTTPQDVALMDSRKAITMALKMMDGVLGVIENMSGYVCPHCGKDIDIFGKDGGKFAANELGVPFLGAIPIDPDIRKDSDKGSPYVVKHNESLAKKAFDNIVKTIKKELNFD